MSTNMNEQTVFVTFAGSSTLEFTNLETVPVYEPATRGWVNLHYTNKTITKVDAWGLATRLTPSTGRVERWYTRPGIAEVLTMGMREGIGGYYYQFRSDGSIHSSSPENGAYYWGPVTIVTMDDPFYVHATVRDYVTDGDGNEIETLEDLHAAFLEKKKVDDETGEFLYRPQSWLFPTSESEEAERRLRSAEAWRAAERASDQRRELDDEDDLMDDDAPLSLVERYEAIERWRDALKVRLETMPGVRDVPSVRKMHEDMIQGADVRLEGLRKDIAREQQKCPECKREGVCMCYT